MMTFSNIPMSFSHHLTFGMHLFWTMALHQPFLRKFTKLILYSKILCLMNLGSSPMSGTALGFFLGIKPCRDQTNTAKEDWKSLRPHFGWQSEQVIQNTYSITSWFGGAVPQHDYLKKHFKSMNPVFNIPRRNELSLLIMSLVTHLPSMMEVLWHNSLLEGTL